MILDINSRVSLNSIATTQESNPRKLFESPLKIFNNSENSKNDETKNETECSEKEEEKNKENDSFALK